MSNTTHIHVGHNIPGHLPETDDVACFDDLDWAMDHLRHELGDQRDYYYEGCRYGNPDGCECGWCSVGNDVEAALSAIADSGPDDHFVGEGRAAWIFSPPEGADMHHWALSITADRDACDIAQEQYA